MDKSVNQCDDIIGGSVEKMVKSITSGITFPASSTGYTTY